MTRAWYWDERRGGRRRHRPGVRRTARRLSRIGLRGFAGVTALIVGGAVVVAFADTTIGLVLVVVGAVTWWGLATVRALQSLDGTAAGALPDHTVTPAQAARLENAQDVAGSLGFGGSGDSGGSGGG